jgi:hypothetical protein
MKEHLISGKNLEMIRNNIVKIAGEKAGENILCGITFQVEGARTLIDMIRGEVHLNWIWT